MSDYGQYRACVRILRQQSRIWVACGKLPQNSSCFGGVPARTERHIPKCGCVCTGGFGPNIYTNLLRAVAPWHCYKLTKFRMTFSFFHMKKWLLFISAEKRRGPGGRTSWKHWVGPKMAVLGKQKKTKKIASLSLELGVRYSCRYQAFCGRNPRRIYHPLRLSRNLKAYLVPGILQTYPHEPPKSQNWANFHKKNAQVFFFAFYFYRCSFHSISYCLCICNDVSYSVVNAAICVIRCAPCKVQQQCCTCEIEEVLENRVRTPWGENTPNTSIRCY